MENFYLLSGRFQDFLILSLLLLKLNVELVFQINLDAAGNKVDFIIARECPTSIVTEMHSHHTDPYQLTEYIEEVTNRADFTQYFFGHYHLNKRIGDKFICLYDKIIEITEHEG